MKRTVICLLLSILFFKGSEHFFSINSQYPSSKSSFENLKTKSPEVTNDQNLFDPLQYSLLITEDDDEEDDNTFNAKKSILARNATALYNSSVLNLSDGLKSHNYKNFSFSSSDKYIFQRALRV